MNKRSYSSFLNEKKKIHRRNHFTEVKSKMNYDKLINFMNELKNNMAKNYKKSKFDSIISFFKQKKVKIMNLRKFNIFGLLFI